MSIVTAIAVWLAVTLAPAAPAEPAQPDTVAAVTVTCTSLEPLLCEGERGWGGGGDGRFTFAANLIDEEGLYHPECDVTLEEGFAPSATCPDGFEVGVNRA